MKTIYMGLNTDPDFVKADEIITRWALKGEENMVEHWKNSKKRTLELRDQIRETVERDGECELSWSCTGRTRHEMHAKNWAEAMPEYDFQISYNYECVVRKKLD